MTTKRWTLLAAVLGSSVVFLDGIVLNVALPAIGQMPRLFVDILEGQNYIQYGYLLTLSALLVLAGALSDYYGRRRLFLIGLVGFGASSLLCGLAPNMELLIVFRLVQGAAGAFLVPGSLAILTNAFSGEEQGRAFGIWAGASSATAILGPLVGGLLVQYVTWRAIFLINLPLIALALYATWRYVQESRDEQADGHFDWLGALLVALAVGGLVFGAHLRPAAAMGLTARLRVARGRRVVHDQPAVLLRPGAPPAGATVDVPVAQLQRDELVDARDLRRAVRGWFVSDRCS